MHKSPKRQAIINAATWKSIVSNQAAYQNGGPALRWAKKLISEMEAADPDIFSEDLDMVDDHQPVMKRRRGRPSSRDLDKRVEQVVSTPPEPSS